MRLVIALISLLLPSLLLGQNVPQDHFVGLRFEEPLPTAFATGEGVPLVGRFDDSLVEVVLFKFITSSGEGEWDFFAPVKNGWFEREIVFTHAAAGLYNLVVFAGGQGPSLPQVGFFEGVQISQGQGPLVLPRRFFPGINFDEPLPTSLATGQVLNLAGTVADRAVGRLVFRFISSTRPAEDFFLFVEDGRFQRSLVFPHGAQDLYTLVLFAGPLRDNLPFVGDFAPFEITPGRGAIQLPRLYFDGLVLDAPLPTQWSVRQPVVLAGVLQPFVRKFRVALEAGGRPTRFLFPGLEGDRFDFPVRLQGNELGPVRLSLIVEDHEGTLREAGAYTIEGVDPPAGDIQVGVLAVALLAGGPGQIPVYNRGTGPLQLGQPVVEGPFAVAASPGLLEPGQAGVIELTYSGEGGDQGLLIVHSDDPLSPRITVALSGVKEPVATELIHLKADAAGHLEAQLDLRAQDQIVALYGAQIDRPDPEAVYDILLDGAGVAAKPGTGLAAELGDTSDSQLRQGERALTRQLRRSGWRAGKPTQVEYQVGDRRAFVFSGAQGVPAQEMEARVVAVNDIGVAFVQEDLLQGPRTIDEAQMRRALDVFAGDYPLLVAHFGAPSDVDGDGKIAVLFTHLIDDIGGVAGQFRADSLLPKSQGGDGNRADLLYLNPALPEAAYRSVLAHEFQHLISFNQHALVRLGLAEEEWLNEGLSHVAEDLVAPFQDSGNYALVRAFLQAPGQVGLSGPTDKTKRGAAYLFVRSLVDMLGPDILLRLVQTDLVDRDNIEAATGENMAELMARWAAQLYISGTDLSDHPRFNYNLAPLHTPTGRGFPPPAWSRYGVGEQAPPLSIRPRGLQYLRVTGQGFANINLQVDPRAAMGAVVLPQPRTQVERLAADYFAGLVLDAPLPGQWETGQGLWIEGTAADSSGEITLEFVPENGAVARVFFLLVDGGRFGRQIYFDHGEAGNYTLNVYRPQALPTPFAGTFFPIRLQPGSGRVQVPPGYFNRIQLDQPLPTQVAQGQKLFLSGEVADAGAQQINFTLANETATETLGLPVVGGRFSGELDFEQVANDHYRLVVEVGPTGALTYVGAVYPFAVVPASTAIENVAAPLAFALHANYPNPFNSQTVLSFTLPEYQEAVELAVYDLLGQKLVVLVEGARSGGVHTAVWDGRDGAGRALASGPYLYRLQAGPYRAVGKLLLLR